MKKIVLLTLVATRIQDSVTRDWFINWLKTGWSEKDEETIRLLNEVLSEDQLTR